MFANITEIDVNCTDIDRKRDSKRRGGSAVLVDLENSGKLRHGSAMIQPKSDGGWSISEHLSSKRMRLCQIHTCVVSVI